ncbi:MAG: hypothetical protein OXI66_03025 [Boseongicola sp.]|nr:hypothetical protein [Boseongicola sp.]MDE0344742.1 hypothetical protein [Boseongicola sp.]MYI69645.1 hypothetical protein [Boseongicola sp. SB0673_bin_14]
MSKARAIGSHVKLAFLGVNSARKLGPEDRQTAMLLFHAVENLVMATLASEDISRMEWRATAGNHQIDRMTSVLPSDCVIKSNLEEFSPLTVYSTGFRYPTASGKVMKAPDEDVTRKWIEQATELVTVFVRNFQVDVTNDDAVAGSTSPFRSKDRGKIDP